jgi:geranylgeranyl pyrophosphate synthase
MCLHAPSRNEASISKVQDLLRKSGALVAMQDRCAQLFQEAKDRLLRSHLETHEQEAITQAIQWVRQSVRVST